ncbi:MAG: hypothetical protein NVS3B10_03640 [Polyangiales bacterium]
MKRTKKLTKKERKAADGRGPAPRQGGGQHIHCIACGRHLEITEFDDPPTATMITCQHGSSFPSCTDCETLSRKLVADHDKSGGEVKTAPAWH